MLLGCYLSRFGVVFSSVVIDCRYNLKQLDRVVSGARFLTAGVLEFDIAHRRSVTVLCMHYMIRCNSMHPFYLYSALPVPYVPVRVTRGGLVTHQYTFAPPRCRTSQYRWTFIPFSVSLWNHLTDPIFDGVGLVGFKSMYMIFIALSCSIPLSLLLFLHLSFFCLYH